MKKTKSVIDKNFKYDPNFKATEPTKILTATRGVTTVIRKLYGPVSEERLAKEQKDVEYRAEQLNPVPKRPERIERDPGAMSSGYVGRDEVRDTKHRQRTDRADRAGQPIRLT